MSEIKPTGVCHGSFTELQLAEGIAEAYGFPKECRPKQDSDGAFVRRNFSVQVIEGDRGREFKVTVRGVVHDREGADDKEGGEGGR